MQRIPDSLADILGGSSSTLLLLGFFSYWLGIRSNTFRAVVMSILALHLGQEGSFFARSLKHYEQKVWPQLRESGSLSLLL